MSVETFGRLSRYAMTAVAFGFWYENVFAGLFIYGLFVTMWEVRQ